MNDRKNGKRINALSLFTSLLLATTLLLAPALARAAQAPAPETKGSVTGLPLPRYVSLKADRVNLRGGPSRNHPTLWVYKRAGLPVEITEEFDVWRKIRDSEGTVGWVLESLLSGRRTALVKPWDKKAVLPIYSRPDRAAAVVAKLQSEVIANVRRCTGTWCDVYGPKFSGWIPQTELWGVYPNEKVN